MVRFKTIGATVLVAALAAGPAMAQGPRGGGAGRGEGRGAGPLGGVPLASLNLTQAQQDQIQAIRERNRQEMEALQARLRSEVLAVLTPEQQAQVQQRQAERSERREGRRGGQRQ